MGAPEILGLLVALAFVVLLVVPTFYGMYRALTAGRIGWFVGILIAWLFGLGWLVGLVYLLGPDRKAA